jgi:hypothetical protein
LTDRSVFYERLHHEQQMTDLGPRRSAAAATQLRRPVIALTVLTAASI